MNTIEFCNYDIASNEIEFKEIITKAVANKPSVISVLPSYIKLSKSLVPEHIKTSCVIDYPFGSSDLKTRLSSTEYAIKNGAQVIELVAPSFFLCHRKYDKFREDIDSHIELCFKYNTELRYILEYRIFTSELLCKAAQILLAHKIKIIYPSTGYFLDELSDNMLASALINQKVADINIVINGNIWNPKHIQTLKSNKHIYGCKTNNLYSLHDIMH